MLMKTTLDYHCHCADRCWPKLLERTVKSDERSLPPLQRNIGEGLGSGLQVLYD